jgi:cysteine sulfinate desulfinase/cysteine desulfurase-like protein
VFHVDGVQAVGKMPIDLKNTSICLRFRVTSCTRRKASARSTFAKRYVAVVHYRRRAGAGPPRGNVRQ